VAQRWNNNASTTIAVTLTDTATQITVVDGTVFPDVSDPDDYFLATIENALAEYEIVKVTAVSGNLLTVVRGDNFSLGDLDKTTSQQWEIGDRIEVRFTAGAIARFVQRVDDTVDGGDFADAAADRLTILPRNSVTGGAAIPTLSRGEIALNLQSRKMYLGAVNAVGADTTVEFVAQVAVQSTSPTYPTDGMFWYNTSNGSCKIYYNGTWNPLTTGEAIGSSILLENGVKIQSRNVGDTADIDLIYLNGSDEIVIGETGVTLIQFLADLVQFEPKIRIRSTGGISGYWDFEARDFLTAPQLLINASGNSSLITLQVKGAGGETRAWTFGFDGRLALQNGILPVDDYHAVPKIYVDDAIEAVKTPGRPLASVRVLGTGALSGNSPGIASVNRTGTGVYVVTLTTGADSPNNLLPMATVTDAASPSIGPGITAVPNTNTQITVYTFNNGTNPSPTDHSFSLVVFDKTAI
jgi:hypothetical protein